MLNDAFEFTRVSNAACCFLKPVRFFKRLRKPDRKRTSATEYNYLAAVINVISNGNAIHVIP